MKTTPLTLLSITFLFAMHSAMGQQHPLLQSGPMLGY
ncbi:MAG: hypothetical protein RI973_1385, partial [Bacteroidota bacterium]